MTRTAPAIRHRAFEDLGVLYLSPAGHGHDVRQFDGVPVPHWRDDVFAVPAGAARLASTPHCPNQAFTADGVSSHRGSTWRPTTARSSRGPSATPRRSSRPELRRADR